VVVVVVVVGGWEVVVVVRPYIRDDVPGGCKQSLTVACTAEKLDQQWHSLYSCTHWPTVRRCTHWPATRLLSSPTVSLAASLPNSASADVHALANSG
jgi:hypothetical protein